MIRTSQGWLFTRKIRTDKCLDPLCASIKNLSGPSLKPDSCHNADVLVPCNTRGYNNDNLRTKKLAGRKSWHHDTLRFPRVSSLQLTRSVPTRFRESPRAMTMSGPCSPMENSEPWCEWYQKVPLGFALSLCENCVAWWRHQMDTFSALLAICAGNSPITGEFPAQRPVTRGFDVFFDLRLNKQWWGWWFESPLHPLWCHCNRYICENYDFLLYALPFSLHTRTWHMAHVHTHACA